MLIRCLLRTADLGRSAPHRKQLLTRSPVDLAPALFRLSLLFVRLRCLAATSANKLTLDGFPSASATLRSRQRNRYLCACTHYLVFKEPETPTASMF
jgi:hypothetical protein